MCMFVCKQLSSVSEITKRAIVKTLFLLSGKQPLCVLVTTQGLTGTTTVVTPERPAFYQINCDEPAITGSWPL